MPLNQMKIITSLYLEEDGEPIEIQRTWIDRLFTRPWRPWVRTRTVVPRIPYRGFYQLGSDAIVVHPAMLETLQEELKFIYGDPNADPRLNPLGALNAPATRYYN